jgi:putative polyketide hydroxylase
VLIVGGGPVGLSAAISLARQGTRSVLVEQRPSTTNHPKARAVNVRTMELLRQWGVADDLMRRVLPQDYWRFVWCTSMTGRELARVSDPEGEGTDHSPMDRQIVAQDAVEEVLHRHGRSLPLASLRFSTRCIDFLQRDNGVTAEVECRETGKRETIEARYLIAADGAASPIRSKLGISMRGPAALSHQASIYFRADLTSYSAHRPADIYYCVDGIWVASSARTSPPNTAAPRSADPSACPICRLRSSTPRSGPLGPRWLSASGTGGSCSPATRRIACRPPGASA